MDRLPEGAGAGEEASRPPRGGFSAVEDAYYDTRTCLHAPVGSNTQGEVEVFVE